MAAITCVTKSISLVAGEKFVLPPGAKLIASTASPGFTSTCPVPTLEEYGCYHTVIAARPADNDGHTEFFEKDEQNVVGYLLNGTYTAFAIPVQNTGYGGQFDMMDLYNKLKADIPTILSGADAYSTDLDNGSKSQLSIKTIPSIANSLQLVVVTNASYDGTTTVRYLVPFMTQAEAATLYTVLPVCS